MLTFNSYTQYIHFLSDHFQGGVTGGGYNPGYVDLTGQIDLHIPAGSTIRNAYLFATAMRHVNHTGFPSQMNLQINNQNVVLSIENALHNNYFVEIYGLPQPTYESRTVIKNISHLNLSSILNIIPAVQVQPPFYWEYYILVLYENANLPHVAVDVFVNNQDADSLTIYPLITSMAIDTNNPIGLALNASCLCDPILDGSLVFVEGNQVGLIGGEDYNHIAGCTGTTSGFYYQNNSLHGLGDDTPTPYVSGSDALSNIQSYVTNNQLIEVEFVYHGTNEVMRSNPINQLFLTYTTPCQPFDVTVPNDTTVCYGSQVQLNATGGSSTGSLPAYEWSPATGLSCTTCPNPFFTADSSMFYTVRIRNNDSCSVVRPVKINVRQKPVAPSVTTQLATCGAVDGSLNAVGIAMQDLFVVSANGDTLVATSQNQMSATVFNLSAGNYTVFYTDTNGCASLDTVVTINSVNNTVASFSVTPSSGGAPLTVNINNTSQYATDYEWFVNGAQQNNPFNGFTADTSGTYQIMLVAWQHDPACADTAYASVWVYDSLIVHIPNVFSPNSDGINDFFLALRSIKQLKHNYKFSTDGEMRCFLLMVF